MDVENSESGDMGFRDEPEYSDYELDSLSEKERAIDPNNSSPHGPKAPEPMELWESKTFTSKANELEKSIETSNWTYRQRPPKFYNARSVGKKNITTSIWQEIMGTTLL